VENGTTTGTGIVGQGAVTQTVDSVKVLRDPSDIISSIRMGNGANYMLSQNYVIDGTTTPVAQWYETVYPGWWMQLPGYSMWTQTVFVDYTKKAMDIANQLMKMNLVNVKTVGNYVDLVDVIRKNLKDESDH